MPTLRTGRVPGMFAVIGLVACSAAIPSSSAHDTQNGTAATTTGHVTLGTIPANDDQFSPGTTVHVNAFVDGAVIA